MAVATRSKEIRVASTRPAGGVVRFSQEAWQELRKVTWPSRETVARLTVIVLVISAVIAGYLFAVDNVFTAVLTRGILGTPATTPVPTAP
jgi:preprotein translocase subunit SecE